MSQLNSSSSSSSQDLSPNIPGTADLSAQTSPPSAKSRFFRYCLLLLALLALVAIIPQVVPLPQPKDSGVEFPLSEPTVTPVASQSAESSAVELSALSYANKQKGEAFKFGRYPQGGNGEIEPITWLVLQREADYMLVIAEQGLDFQPYNEKNCDITWYDCSLRRWLNSKFYNKAFNAQEQKRILKTVNDNNAGPKTDDYVYVLSVDEAVRLFANDGARCAKPTQYAKNNGVRSCDNGCCCWWLRSRGLHASDADYVRNDGCTCINGLVTHVNIAARPVIRLAL